MTTWENHKPGFTRLYGEHHRVTVNRSLMGGWLWTVDRCSRGRTKEAAHGRMSTRGHARIVGAMLMSTLDNIEICRLEPALGAADRETLEFLSSFGAVDVELS